MTSRRQFIQQSTLVSMGLVLPESLNFLTTKKKNFSFQSDYLKVELCGSRPGFLFFSTDSLGKRQFHLNLLLEIEHGLEKSYESLIKPDEITWYSQQVLAWQCKLEQKIITLRTHWEEGIQSIPFDIIFSQKINHCTVLGKMAGEKQMEFPCILHFPGMGSFRIYCSNPDVLLLYDANRHDEKPFIKIGMNAADRTYHDITYFFESVAIYPKDDRLNEDSRFDGYKKNYINIFQMNPRVCMLANNSASDACAFTLYIYAEMARYTPKLAKGLTAMDLICDTLDRYLSGMLGYGQVGYGVNKGQALWESAYNSSDSFPSLIIAACYYILSNEEKQWAFANYDGIKQWAERMVAMDTNHDGIVEYGYSGNSGSWNSKHIKRPANWWDTIGFGHDDAYSNILVYRALTLLSDVAFQLNKFDDSQYFSSLAQRLKNTFYRWFYNQETGILGGWRSSDGRLHDYYFTFINSMAICYNLVDKDEGREIMGKILDKMKEVGYNDFHLGLPGNLIPIADEDYVHHDPRWGYQNFQAYENGGATGCYVYFTIHALFKLNMVEQAEQILFAMLESYKSGNFMGSCLNSGKSRDWKAWDGKCWGYEGFLVDNYLALLNVLDYLKEI